MENKKLIAKLGETIGTIRKKKGISQVELGKISKTSQMTVQRIESGNGGGTRIEAIFTIAKALDVRLVDIFHELEKRSSTAKKSSKSNWEKVSEQVNNLSPTDKEWVSDILTKVLEHTRD